MAENIIVLSEKDKARKRINVFHGSSTNWINMIKELIGNSLDVFDKNKLNTINIILHNNNKIEYIDSGIGIPVEGTASDGSPNYQAIFEKDFAGSRYDNQSATIGQNGIFLYTLSMTCKDIEYYIGRPNGKLYHVSYRQGDRINDLKVIGKENKTYSRIIFSLDEEVWSEPNFTFEEICTISKAQASLANVKITIEDRENNKFQEFYYPNGIEGYFNEATANKSIVSDNVRVQKSLEYEIETGNIDAKAKYNDNISIDLIFNYSNDSNDDFQKEFLNTADLLLHGTIQEGILNGLRTSIDGWLSKNNKYNKNEKRITLDDISTGLNYICNVSSLYVEYDNQIKQKTSVKHYRTIIKKVIEDFMEIYFIENRLMSEKICNQVLVNLRARTKSEQTRLDIRKKLESNISVVNKVEGLIECKSKDKEANILCICEGKSALSAMISGRQDIHALFPIRGKILNCLKAPLEKIMNSDVIINMMKALGCGIEVKTNKKDMSSFDIAKLRYSKICIYVDADFDGMGSILPLLLTVFWKLTPTLVKDGRIYLCETPKYEIIVGDEYLYAVDDEELAILQDKLRGKKYSLHYIKGLSELSAETMAMCLRPDYKNIKQISLDDVKESIDMLELFMGEDISPRRDYILTNFDK